jgi:hypothetical protein
VGKTRRNNGQNDVHHRHERHPAEMSVISGRLTVMKIILEWRGAA